MLGQFSPRLPVVGVMALGLFAALATVPETISPLSESASLLAQTTRWLAVTDISGQVTYRGRESRIARLGDQLVAGQGLATHHRATAILNVDDDIGVIRVAEQTDLVVTQLGILSDGARITKLRINQGQARVQARPFTNPNSLLEVTTPTGVVSVRGTEYGISVAEDGKTAVGTLEGSVITEAAGQ
ncbi:MAG: FecR family protein, partial [Cyanobacteria bacterium J06638_6]